MILDNLSILKDLGVGIVSLLIIYGLGKKVTENAFGQIKEANKQIKETSDRSEEIYKQFIDFMQKSYKESTEAIVKLCTLISEDMKNKEEKLKIINEYKEMLKEEIHEHRKQVPKEYRK